MHVQLWKVGTDIALEARRGRPRRSVSLRRPRLLDDDRRAALRRLARNLGIKAGDFRRDVGSVFRRFAVCDCEKKLQHSLLLENIQQPFDRWPERQIVGYE